MKSNQILYYQKAKEFLWLWADLGNKKETQKYLQKLEKAREKAIKEGWLIDYSSLHEKTWKYA